MNLMRYQKTIQLFVYSGLESFSLRLINRSGPVRGCLRANDKFVIAKGNVHKYH